MRITDEHKEHVHRKVLEAIVAGLRNNHIVEDHLSEIAEYVLQGTRNISTHEELVAFLKDISQKWPIFILYLDIEDESEGGLKKITDMHREETFRKILEAIITGLRANTLLVEELPDIADYVLKKMNKVKTPDELHDFLNTLSDKWPLSIHYLKISL